MLETVIDDIGDPALRNKAEEVLAAARKNRPKPGDVTPIFALPEEDAALSS